LLANNERRYINNHAHLAGYNLVHAPTLDANHHNRNTSCVDIPAGRELKEEIEWNATPQIYSES